MECIFKRFFSPTYCLGEAGSGKGKTFDVETFILTQNQHSSSEPIFVVLTFLFSLKDHKVVAAFQPAPDRAKKAIKPCIPSS